MIELFKELSGILERAGYQVRRERLRQGFGWRVVSGTCRHESNKFIFVDRKLSHDDQIGFLLSRIRLLNLALSHEEIALLPEKWQSAFSPEAQSAAQAA